jgi:hypothetical protein
MSDGKGRIAGTGKDVNAVGRLVDGPLHPLGRDGDPIVRQQAASGFFEPFPGGLGIDSNTYFAYNLQ